MKRTTCAALWILGILGVLCIIGILADSTR